METRQDTPRAKTRIQIALIAFTDELLLESAAQLGHEPYSSSFSVELVVTDQPLRARQFMPKHVRIVRQRHLFFREWRSYVRRVGQSPGSHRIEYGPVFLESRELFFRNIDRFCDKPLSATEIIEYHRDLWNYFSVTLQDLSIDLVIFNTIPHMLFDQTALFVARSLDIDVLMLEPTLIKNRVALSRGWESNLLPTNSSFLSSEEESGWGGSYYNISLNRNDAARRGRANRFRKVLSIRKVASALRSYIKLLANPYQSTFALSSVRGPSRKLARYYAVSLKYSSLLRYYNQKTTSDFPDTNFAVFFLSYQTENVTTISVGPFDDQLFAIQILRNVLPSSMPIIVKEHPAQYQSNWNLNKLAYRRKELYQAISEIPDTYLADWKIDSGLLMKQASLVSVLTNSAGWEALVDGTPVVAFGYPWYREHPDCIVVPGTSFKDLKKLAEEALTIEPDAIKRRTNTFIKRMKECVIDLPTESQFLEWDRSAAIEALPRAICNLYESEHV